MVFRPKTQEGWKVGRACRVQRETVTFVSMKESSTEGTGMEDEVKKDDLTGELGDRLYYRGGHSRLCRLLTQSSYLP